eukprot:6202376-Pleurochrysis_carterae.AAC.2
MSATWHVTAERASTQLISCRKNFKSECTSGRRSRVERSELVQVKRARRGIGANASGDLARRGQKFEHKIARIFRQDTTRAKSETRREECGALHSRELRNVRACLPVLRGRLKRAPRGRAPPSRS